MTFQSVLSSTADAVSILTGVAVLVVGSLATSPARRRVIAWTKARTLRPAINELQRSHAWETTSRRRMRRACIGLVRERLQALRATTIVDELTWLSTVTAAGGSAVTYIPAALSPARSDANARGLAALATRYESYAIRLVSSPLLRVGSQGMSAPEAALARSVAQHLRRESVFVPLATPSEPVDVPLTGERLLTLFAYPDASQRPRPTLDSAEFSYISSRLAARDTPAFAAANRDGVPVEELRLSAEEAAALKRRFARGDTFDGILPSLQLTSLGDPLFSVERDALSGRGRLHMSVRETTFGSVMATHYVGAHGIGRTTDQLAGEASLVTLSLLVITRDDKALLVERSHAVAIGRGQVAPAVNGNLEMSTREGISSDADSSGRPDPARALMREAREELGLEGADALQMVPLGLARFDTVEEKRVHLLSYMAATPLTVMEVLRGIEQADVFEGRWEIGPRLLAIDIQQLKKSRNLEDLIDWLCGDANVLPHATATVLMALAARGLLSMADLPGRVATEWPSERPPACVQVLRVGG